MSAKTPPPSRKRSKWEGDDDELEENVLITPPPRRRQKHSNSRGQPRARARSESPPPPVPTRPNHSIYVPPRTHHVAIIPSRSVYCYERLNQIEEGSYGVVFRARDKQSGDIVALKKLKLDDEKHGFPITALREVNALMTCRHENVVGIREVVVGDTLTQYVSSIFFRSPHIGTGLDILFLCDTLTLFGCLVLVQSLRGYGFHRTRPQNTAYQHARPILAI